MQTDRASAMLVVFPVMEAVRSGGPENICKDILCPDGRVMFRLTAKK